MWERQSTCRKNVCVCVKKRVCRSWCTCARVKQQKVNLKEEERKRKEERQIETEAEEEEEGMIVEKERAT